MSSTETGVIFGNIVYESTSVLDRSVVVLNDIHIDIMDYISPGTCADVAFRNMWAEFEWENKVRRSPAVCPSLSPVGRTRDSIDWCWVDQCGVGLYWVVLGGLMRCWVLLGGVPGGHQHEHLGHQRVLAAHCGLDQHEVPNSPVRSPVTILP